MLSTVFLALHLEAELNTTEQLLELDDLVEVDAADLDELLDAVEAAELLDKVLLDEVEAAEVDDVDVLLEDIHALLDDGDDVLDDLLLEEQLLLQEDLLVDDLLLELLLEEELLDRNLLPRLELQLLEDLRKLLLQDDDVELLEVDDLLLEVVLVEDELVQDVDVGLEIDVIEVDVANSLVLEALSLVATEDLVLVVEVLVVGDLGRDVLVVAGLVGSNVVGDLNIRGVNALNRGSDLIRGGILDEQVLGEDAALGVILIVAGVAGASWVINITGLEGAGLEGLERVTANRSNLGSKLKGDILVELGRTVRGRVLVLLQGSNLRVDGIDGSAGNRGQANGASVALKSAVDERSDLTLDITSSHGVGESLVGSGLLQAV